MNTGKNDFRTCPTAIIVSFAGFINSPISIIINAIG
jgi:hypothetical protein